LVTTQTRLDEECAQLLVDIRRIGEAGEPHVLFGELFDDDDVANYYEALVGTLKAAKKRGLIEFKGQMLLKGVNDKTKISIVEK
jgi:Costars